MPGRVSLLVKRIRARQHGGATQPPLVVLAGGPGQSATDAFGGGGAERALPGLLEARRDRLRPARHGSLRARCAAAALERANLFERRAARRARAPRSLGARRAFYTTRDTDGRHRRDPPGARRRADRALRHLVRHQGRAGLRAAATRPASSGSCSTRWSRSTARTRSTATASRAVPRALRSLCGRACRRGRAIRWPTSSRLVGRIAPARAAARDRSWTRAAGRGPTGSRAWTCSASCWPATSTRRCGRPSPARCAPALERRRRADAAPAAARVRDRRRAAAAARAQLGAVRGHDLRGDARAVAARHAARPGASGTGRPRRTRRPCPTRRSRPSTAPRRSPATCSTLCERWPRAPAAPTSAPARSRTCPCCSLEGEDDLRTPVENAQRVARLFPRAQLVVAPATGHSALGSDFYGCARRAFARFFQRRQVPRAAARGRASSRPSRPPPRRLSAVPSRCAAPRASAGARSPR